MASMTEFLELYPKTGTWRNYRSALIKFLSFIYKQERKGIKATPEEYQGYVLLSDQYIREVKAGERDPFLDLERFVVSMNGSAPKTTRVRVAAVKEWLAHNRIKIESDDAKRIRRKIPRNRTITEEKTLTKEMIGSILQHLDIRGRALVLFLASSGMRIGEALQVELSDIDLTRTPAPVKVRAEITKTDQERITFISEECKETLKEWLKVRVDRMAAAHCRGRRFSGENKLNDNRVFAIERTAAHMIWHTGVKKAGFYSQDKRSNIGQVRIHALRKFFRSYMGLKIPSDIVEALIGHAEGLDNVYRRYTPEQLAMEYLKGMDQVTFKGAEDLQVKKKIQDQEARIKDLEADRERLNAQVNELRAVVQLVLENRKKE
jgi:integrase